MASPDLLPCPFCGCDVVDFGSTINGTAFVNCGDCCAHTGGALLDDKRTLEDAARDWNDRTARWEPIATAPRDTDVLCWLDDGSMQVGIFDTSYQAWVFTGLDDSGMEPTHWAPLPAAPTPETT